MEEPPAEDDYAMAMKDDDDDEDDEEMEEEDDMMQHEHQQHHHHQEEVGDFLDHEPTKEEIWEVIFFLLLRFRSVEFSWFVFLVFLRCFSRERIQLMRFLFRPGTKGICALRE
jgi:hypothetical protein